MSYTINPNAKNRWARNAENTMDLSLETDASSVYLDNGRTLEQEIGEGSMVSNVTTVDSAMSKIINGTLDGAYESLVFKGKSLVNIIDYNKKSFNEGNTLDSGVITINHQGGSYSNAFFLTPDNIKPSTDYFVIFNVISNTYENHVKLMSDDDTACCFDYNLTIQAKTTGLHKMKVTSKSNLSSCRYLLRTFGYNNTNNGSCQYRVMVIEYIEGMENWDIPYFEGLCDVKMPILHNVGKNLFDGKLKVGNINSGNGETYEVPHMRTTDFIKINENKAITISKLNNSDIDFKVEKVVYYDTNKNFIGVNGELFMFPKTLTPPTGVAYIRVVFCKGEWDTTATEEDFKTLQVQIEEGSAATPYEPYKSNILHTSEEVVLRKVGDVCDSYDALTGEYVQRVGEVVYDNTNVTGFYVSDSYQKEGCTTFMRPVDKTFKKEPKMISNLLPFSPIGHWNDIDECLFAGTVLVIRLKSTKASNVIELREYLNQYPLTVQYELATPITTIVEPLTIPFAYQNGHVILESGYEGQSLLPTLEYSTVVNKTGLVENVAKTIQRQEKQLTMLEQMLIQNIINLDYNNTLLTLKNEMEEML